MFVHTPGPKNDILDWSKRYKIALGAADGLLYLHDSCQRRIIHRDIKADNILLTEDFVPQVFATLMPQFNHTLTLEVLPYFLYFLVDFVKFTNC